MGDESESDTEPTEQPDDRDDVLAESDETATPSTDDSPDPVDDTTSDDTDPSDTAPDDVDLDRTDDPEDAPDPEATDDTDVSEPPLQPGASNDVEPADDGDTGLEQVSADRDTDEHVAANGSELDHDDEWDAGGHEDDEDEPFDPADSPALQASEGGFDDPEEGFGDPVADETDDFDDDFTTPDGFEDDFDDDFEDGLADGPDTDQEMPLADHIEEMVRRLAVVFLVGGAVALSVFGLGEVLQYVPSTIDIINFLWNRHIPGAGVPGNEALRPHIYGPLELILTKLKVASLAGVVVGLPVFVYESYLFMRPGLYQNERKYYLASVPTSLILAVIGVAFAHFVVLPSIFAYFTSYTEGTAVIAFGLAETFNLILILMGYMAIVFQIPLFIMLAIMMNLVTRQWLEDKRLIFWGSFLGLAFLVSPDPTGMAPIIIAITMVALFEGTLLLLRWTGN